MAVLTHQCPHCGSSKAAMSIIHIGQRDSGVSWLTLECPACRSHCLAHVRCNVPANHWQGDVRNLAAFSLYGFYPALPPIAAPEHLPDNVQAAYLEALHSLRDKRYTLAGMGFRRALELALKAIKPDMKGQLRDRIDALTAEHELTPAMGEFAHHVRLEGNAAAHDLDEFSEADANGLQSFVELFLTYQFTLPRRLEATRTK